MLLINVSSWERVCHVSAWCKEIYNCALLTRRLLKSQSEELHVCVGMGIIWWIQWLLGLNFGGRVGESFGIPSWTQLAHTTTYPTFWSRKWPLLKSGGSTFGAEGALPAEAGNLHAFQTQEIGIVCASNGDGSFTGLNSAGGRKKKEQKNRCIRHVQCSSPKTLESDQFKSSIYKISFPSFIFLAQALQRKPGVSELGGTCGGNDWAPLSPQRQNESAPG